jgi:magnesium transporter
MSARRAGPLLGQFSLDTAAALLRRLQEAEQERVLQAAPDEAAASLRLVLQFPEGTAGALMDPRALCVPEDFMVRRAREQVRRSAQHILYYLYVVDRERKLVGVLSLRQLFLASGKDLLGAVMTPHVARLSVSADQGAILAHPGWRDYHALPVVDAAGRFVGAIRHAALRKLEEQREPPPSSAQALSVALALGELYWLALGGMVRNLWPGGASGPATQREGRETDGA